jgi:hypothetical protein
MSWSVGHTKKQKAESENSRESAHGANAAPEDIAAAGGSGDEPVDDRPVAARQMVTAKDGAGGRGEWEWDRGIAGSAAAGRWSGGC